MKKIKKFNLNFQLLIFSKVVSIVGGNVLGFALILFLVSFTESPSTLAIVMAVSQVPPLLLAPFGGVIADRFNKKKLITFFDFITALSCFFLLWTLSAGTVTVLLIGLLRTLKIAIATVAGPVFSASVPRMVDEEYLVEANGLIQSIGALGMIAGSVLGGVLFTFLGIYNIALISGIFFLISTLIDLFLKIPFEKRPVESGLLNTFAGDIKESFIFLRQEKPMIFNISLVGAFLNSAFNPIFIIGLPFIVVMVFGRNVGVSYGIASLGMLFGGMVTGKFKQHLILTNLPKWVFAFALTGLLLAFSISTAVLDVSTTLGFWIFNFTLFGMMLLACFMSVIVGTTIQKETPPHLLGKVNSLVNLFSSGLGPIGTLLFGFTKELLNDQVHFLFFAFTIIILLCSFMVRKIIGASSVKMIENK